MAHERILIVEDEAVTAMSIGKILTDRGYCVAGIIPDGETVLARLGDLKPDLVLMDIELAGSMNGIETAENIRMRHHLPVIYLTAYSDDRCLDLARKTEPFGCIVKPIREDELRAAIEMALYKHRSDEMIRKSEESLRTMVNVLPDAIAFMDRDRRIITANESGARTLGAPGEILAGSTGADPGHCPGAGTAIPLPDNSDTAFQSGCPVETEVKEGDRWFETSIRPVKDPADRISSIVIQYHDISRKRTRYEEIQEEIRRQVAGNREEFEKFSDRIRNPLQVIKGYAFPGFSRSGS